MKIMNLKISLLVTSALVPLVLTSVAPVFAMETDGIEGTADIARPAGTAATTLNVKDAEKRKAAAPAAAASANKETGEEPKQRKISNLLVAAETGSAAPAGGVFFKQEPGTSSSPSSSSSSPLLGRAIKQEGGGGGVGAPFTREDDAGESPSRFTKILQQLETATGADVEQLNRDISDVFERANDEERALICRSIFEHDNLNPIYRSRVSIALKLLEIKR